MNKSIYLGAFLYYFLCANTTFVIFPLVVKCINTCTYFVFVLVCGIPEIVFKCFLYE
jgi:hypothetical protein